MATSSSMLPGSRRPMRTLVWGIAWAIAWSGPASAHRAAPEAPSTPDVGALWRDANAKLGTGDYAVAIDELTQVFEAIASDPEARTLRMRVRMALHDAHRGAYRIDGNAEHLALAREVLHNGLGEFGPDDVELRASAEAAITSLDADLAALEAERVREQERRADADAAARRAQEPVPAPIPAKGSADVAVDRDPVVDDGAARRRTWLAVAGTGAGLGVVGIALLGGGFGSANAAVGVFEDDPDQRDAARRSIQRGNALGIAGAVLAGVGLTAVAIALPLARRARRGAGRVALLPGPTRIGLRVRF